MYPYVLKSELKSYSTKTESLFTTRSVNLELMAVKDTGDQSPKTGQSLVINGLLSSQSHRSISIAWSGHGRELWKRSGKSSIELRD
jgi:hypothetical protein